MYDRLNPDPVWKMSTGQIDDYVNRVLSHFPGWENEGHEALKAKFGRLYLMASSLDLPVKIGWSKNPDSRVKSLQWFASRNFGGTPKDWRVMGQVDASAHEEWAFHRNPLYASCRVPLSRFTYIPSRPPKTGQYGATEFYEYRDAVADFCLKRGLMLSESRQLSLL